MRGEILLTVGHLSCLLLLVAVQSAAIIEEVLRERR